MTISDDLFRAILAMDSYNRGTNAGLKVDGSSIGLAVLGEPADGPAAQNASFFAQAYDWNGKVVISYRGSDGVLPTWLGGNVPSDVPAWYIWFSDNYNTAQARMAARFYLQLEANHSTACRLAPRPKRSGVARERRSLFLLSRSSNARAGIFKRLAERSRLAALTRVVRERKWKVAALLLLRRHPA